jgi:hypothetical protein
MAVASRLQNATDTAANWISNDPVLLAGEFGYESDTSKWKIGDGSSLWSALPYANPAVTIAKSITLLSPTSSEDISLWYQTSAATITAMRVVLVGSSTPSVTWTIRHGSDRNATGAEVVTGGTTTTTTTSVQTVSVFDDATISAGSHVWLETTAQSGTVDSINITIEYEE